MPTTMGVERDSQTSSGRVSVTRARLFAGTVSRDLCVTKHSPLSREIPVQPRMPDLGAGKLEQMICRTWHGALRGRLD
jgi:hypothetical protein